MNPDLLKAFMAEYEQQLERAVLAHPGQYGYPVELVPTVADRMRAAIEKGSFNHDGYAFKWTCKALGIKHTRKAIVAFLSGANAPQTQETQ